MKTNSENEKQVAFGVSCSFFLAVVINILSTTLIHTQ